LQRRLPDASEDRLVQFTAACHMKGITDKNLGENRLLEDAGIVHISHSWPPGPAAMVDLRTPMPSPEQAMRQMQAYDQRQAAQQQQINAQHQDGPARAF